MKRVTISDPLHLRPSEIEAVPGRLPLNEAQQREVLRRSEAHRLNPEEAVSLDQALEQIERSLG